MKDDVTFLIPVRGGSTRIPRKNLLVLDGETLIARKVRQLLPLGKVVVGSDDEEMLEEAGRSGAETARRTKTNEGEDSANQMIAEFLDLIEPCDTVAWCHCTNPLISTETYRKAIETYRDRRQYDYDSLVSVHEMHEHFWYADRRTPAYNVTWCRNVRHLLAGETPPMYIQDGSIFIQPYARMKENHYFFGERPWLFKVPDEEFCDLNTPEDWEMCRALHEFRGRPK